MLKNVFRVVILTFFALQVAHAQNFDEQSFLKKLHLPEHFSEFKTVPHWPTINQDTTSACWAFATTSFLESEMQRLGLDTVRLSMMFPFFHAYIEKVRRFVQTKGQSRVAPGGLFSDVLDMVQKYGLVPYSAYPGLPAGRQTYNQKRMYRQIDSLLQKVKQLQIWDEDLVLYKTRQILYRHMGVPPQVFTYRGRRYDPKSFLKRVVRLPWHDYLMVTSFTYAPFFQFVELKVPDNWAHQKCYFNFPLKLFYSGLQNAIKKGYSLAIDSDISEPGRKGNLDATFVVPYDIPGKFIDQQARQLRFDNHSTTDDHLMHLIGFTHNHGNDWFLVKDSWRSAWYGKKEFNGYYMFHENYIRLKVLAYLVHKEAIQEIANKVDKLKRAP